MNKNLIISLINRLMRCLMGFRIGKPIDEASYKYIVHNRRRWKKQKSKKASGVILVGLFEYPIMTYCYAQVLNWLKVNTDAALESYYFRGKHNAVLQAVYDSFGAKHGLGVQDLERFREQTKKEAEEIFSALETKWDVLAIKTQRIKIGDLVYDSYLRYLDEETVKIRDQRLLEIIHDALMILHASLEYFQKNAVRVFFADDYGYIHGGIPTRVAMSKNVPVYLVFFGENFFVFPLSEEKITGSHDYPILWPYHRYREIFKSLPSEKQQSGIQKGREHINSKLSGVIDKFTLQTITAYGTAEGRALSLSNKPKMLILLHDFFDAPHGFRSILFPDFFEWIHFLLTKAEQTPFEWYVKPHPCVWDESAGQVNAKNKRVIDALKSRFQSINWLKPQTSNLQLVDEGISTVFTVYGTAGHEFAYLGIPVVNAGDNPHISYAFNFHPESVDEYAGLIDKADQLQIVVDNRDVDEYCYMNYFYFPDTFSTRANPIASSFFNDVDCATHYTEKSSFQTFVAGESAERDSALDAYLSSAFSSVVAKR